jgi:hypothetical protein
MCIGIVEKELHGIHCIVNYNWKLSSTPNPYFWSIAREAEWKPQCWICINQNLLWTSKTVRNKGFAKKLKWYIKRLMHLPIAFIQAWNEEIDFLIYLKQRILFCTWNLKQTKFFKNNDKLKFVTRKIASHGYFLCWFALNVWLWVGHEPYHNLRSVCNLVAVLLHL